MTDDSRAARWRALQQHLEAMLALAGDARAAAMQELRRRDAALADEVQALLLQAHVAPLPEELPEQIWQGLFDHAGDGAGKHFGAFIAETEIGRGGSGVVYRAHRDGDFAQTVAIKLLSGARADLASVRRLQHERDVLAALDHAGIVRLLDAGVDADAQPYLVLEYVDGLTWDRFLAAHRPEVQQRLQLFARVCDAVAYAHQRLLVHRDIKPGNLMVDRQGRAKLLDYGIAKLLAEPEDSTLTRDFGSSLTPAYAAPEQLRGETVTTATDVHALGILLYETLCGAHPFRNEQQRGDALRLALLNEAPPPISTHPGLIDLPPAWRQDLQKVLSKALAKDPEQRYASAKELADDVRAVLAGLPVRAQAPSTAYVLRRFVGRHRLAVGSALVAAVLLMLSVGAALWQWRVATAEHARAERRFQDVHRFANIVLFDYQEGIRKLSGSLPMQQRLVADALRYLESLTQDAGDDPILRADLVRAYLKIGDLQGNPYGPNLGDLSGAASSYDRADALLKDLRGTDSAATALLGAQLLARRADLAHQRGDQQLARAGFEAASLAFAGLPASLADNPEVSVEHAHLLDHYGDFLGRQGGASMNEVAASRQAHQQARALRENALSKSPLHRELQFGLYHSALRDGEYWFGQSDLNRAEAAYRDAEQRIAALVEIDPDDSFYRYEQALVHSSLVPVLEARGDLDGSIEAALAALRTTELLLDRDRGNDMLKQAVSASCGWAARQLLKGKRATEAMPIVARQIEINQQWLAAGPDNPEARLALSLAYRRQGELREALADYAGAIDSHRAALDRQRELAGQSPDFALSYALSFMHLGRNQVSAGAVTEGRASLKDSTTRLAEIAQTNPEAERYRDYLAEAYAQLAEAFTATPADAAEARRAADAALAIWAAFETNGKLSPSADARRRALREKLAID